MLRDFTFIELDTNPGSIRGFQGSIFDPRYPVHNFMRPWNQEVIKTFLN